MSITWQNATTEDWGKLMNFLKVNYRSDIEEFSDYVVMLSADNKFKALDFGGVDNWNGYGYARELAEGDGQDWFNLSDSGKLTYLEYAGVDNWSYYGESISDYQVDELLNNAEYYEEDLKILAKDVPDWAEFFDEKFKEMDA